MELTDAHAALADAEATAALLAAYMRASGERRMWDEWLAFGETIRWPAPPRLATPPVWRGFARQLTAPGSDLMDRVAGSFERVEGLEGADDVARLNRHYMLGVVDAVCADGQLTREERDTPVRCRGRG